MNCIVFQTIDPEICGFGVLASVPLIFAMTVLARGPEAPTYITFFFGQWFLNLNWALATDMLMVGPILNLLIILHCT